MSKQGKNSKKATGGKAEGKKSGQAARVRAGAKKLAEKINLEGRIDQLKTKLEKAWEEGEHKSEALWHQTAVASLQWISSHKTLTDDFKKSVKGTVLEKPVNSALKAIRAEARAAKTEEKSAPAKKSGRSTARKTAAVKKPGGTTGRKTAPAKKPARTTGSKATAKPRKKTGSGASPKGKTT